MIQAFHTAGIGVIMDVVFNHTYSLDSCFQKTVPDYFYRKNGDVWHWDLWQPGLAIVDFTNPDAKKWYQDKLAALLDQGVDCVKTDFGERIPLDAAWFDGSDPAKMHNYYTQLYNGAVFELLERKRGRGEAVVFAQRIQEVAGIHLVLEPLSCPLALLNGKGRAVHVRECLNLLLLPLRDFGHFCDRRWDLVVWLACDGVGAIVGTGAVSLVEKPPYSGCPTGRIALLSSVYTLPDCRRWGVASEIL